jgi:hypothetical protein
MPCNKPLTQKKLKVVPTYKSISNKPISVVDKFVLVSSTLVKNIDPSRIT